MSPAVSGPKSITAVRRSASVSVLRITSASTCRLKLSARPSAVSSCRSLFPRNFPVSGRSGIAGYHAPRNVAVRCMQDPQPRTDQVWRCLSPPPSRTRGATFATDRSVRSAPAPSVPWASRSTLPAVPFPSLNSRVNFLWSNHRHYLIKVQGRRFARGLRREICFGSCSAFNIVCRRRCSQSIRAPASERFSSVSRSTSARYSSTYRVP